MPVPFPSMRAIHRWLALVFLAPLLILIVTGFVLSFEPAMQIAHRNSVAIDPVGFAALVKQHDPQAQARRIDLRTYDRSMEIALPGRPPVVVDIDSGQTRSRGALAAIFDMARHVHIRMFWRDALLVKASTFALVVIMLAGVFLARPGFGRGMSGWHRGAAWFTLPLLAAIAVTGLLMSFNITFGGGGSAPMTIGVMKQKGNLQSLFEAGLQDHEKRSVVWLRAMGPRTMMRTIENQRFQGYFITPAGLVKAPPNLPRGFHEGLWFGYGGPALNLAASFAFLVLCYTGAAIWWRRASRRRRRHAALS